MDWSKIRVVELASVLAGPAVGTFFVELGASVMKFENKGTKGDVTRKWHLPNEDKSNKVTAYFSSVNHSKNYIEVDLNLKKDLEKVKSAIEGAHIVLANFKEGSAEKYDLDFNSVKSINSNIIYGNITGYPAGNRPAFDVVLQAETGFLSMSGTLAGELVKMPVAFIDVLAAHQLKEGILVALLEQLHDRKAKKVEVSLYEAALASLMNQGSNYLMANHIPKPMGTAHPNIAPYGDMVATSSGSRIVLAVGTEAHFKALCQCLNEERKIEEDAFSTNAKRVRNRKALMEWVSFCFLKHGDEILTDMEKRGIPFGRIKTLEEVFQEKTAQEGIIESTEQGISTKRYKHNVFKIS